MYGVKHSPSIYDIILGVLSIIPTLPFILSGSVIVCVQGNTGNLIGKGTGPDVV